MEENNYNKKSSDKLKHTQYQKVKSSVHIQLWHHHQAPVKEASCEKIQNSMISEE